MEQKIVRKNISGQAVDVCATRGNFRERMVQVTLITELSSVAGLPVSETVTGAPTGSDFKRYMLSRG